MTVADIQTVSDLGPVQRLTRDIRQASRLLSRLEARWLVDTYYQLQENRIRSKHQERILDETGEPKDVTEWLAVQNFTLEKQIAGALKYYAEGDPLGRWALSICGVGPVIAAGLLSRIDMAKVQTAGQIWSYAGLNPEAKWEKGQDRPWNTPLKTLCAFKLGECFVKVQGNEKDVYGKLYVSRKEEEWAKNVDGENAPAAAEALTRKKFGADTEASLWYNGCLGPDAVKVYFETPSEKRQGIVKKLAGEPGSGVAMLPPAHIHARARRYAVKIFLSHYFTVGFRLLHGTEPPKPFVIEHLGHAHMIDVPNWPIK